MWRTNANCIDEGSFNALCIGHRPPRSQLPREPPLNGTSEQDTESQALNGAGCHRWREKMFDFEHRFDHDGKSGFAEARWNSNSERYELRAINITTPEPFRVTPHSDAATRASVDTLTRHVISDIRKADPCKFQRGCIAAYEAGLPKSPPFDPVREYGTHDHRAL